MVVVVVDLEMVVVGLKPEWNSSNNIEIILHFCSIISCLLRLSQEFLSSAFKYSIWAIFICDNKYFPFSIKLGQVDNISSDILCSIKSVWWLLKKEET